MPSHLSSMFVLLSLLHGLGTYCTALSLVGGAVSFVHIVKASEPVFSAFFSFTITGKGFPLPVYVSLAPIICGVCFASLQDLSFSVSSFLAALLSNTFYQLRVVLFKRFVLSPDSDSDTDTDTADTCHRPSRSDAFQLTTTADGYRIIPSRSRSRGTHGDKAPTATAAVTAGSLFPSTAFRIMTVLAFLLLVPLALVLEGGAFPLALRVLRNSASSRGDPATREHSQTSSAEGEGEEGVVMTVGDVLVDILLAGFSFFVYNEASFVFLHLIHPVSHAVTNALKRVVIIAASVLVFHTPLSTQVIAGSSLAIAGTLLYSLLLHHYNKKRVIAATSAMALPSH